MAKKAASSKPKAPDPRAGRIEKLKELIAADEGLLKRLAEREARAKERLAKRHAELAELEGGSKESKPKIVLGEPTPSEKKGCLMVLWELLKKYW